MKPSLLQKLQSLSERHEELAALLGDEQLSHNARYALQMNPDPAVDEALRGALGTVKGKPLRSNSRKILHTPTLEPYS